ncbi:carbon-nitrogen hydrolase [Xylariaceae sp. FL0255]|nr:carbon-nitrogen hydrolase [Xylariaceae sp. FL0255]
MTPTLKIALIHPFNPNRTSSKAKEGITKASQTGAHLAVFPEYHLTSWIPEDPRFIAVCAESSASDYIERYQALARDLNIHIVPGAITNVVTESGQILFTPTFTPSPPRTSSFHRAFDVPLSHLSGSGASASMTIRVGLLICWDLSAPEAMRALVAARAQLVIILAYWHLNPPFIPTSISSLNPKSESVFLNSVVVAQACESTCAVAFCNSWGCKNGESGSMRDDETMEKTILSEVDLEALEVAEAHYKIRADLLGQSWPYSPSK